MKKFAHLVAAVLVIAVLCWALWRGITHREKAEADEPSEAAPAAAAEAETETQEFVVSLKKEKWESLGLAVAEPEKYELVPSRAAYGRVLDPYPLVALDGELATAEAAASASRAEYERTQKLLAAGENTSRKIFEAAEAQYRADDVKAESLRRQAALQWGTAVPFQEPEKRRAFVDTLVRGGAALVRADLLPGDAIAKLPRAARLVVLGHDDQPLQTTQLSPSADTDARTQAQGFIMLIPEPPFALRPGMALTAWLELDEKPRSGFVVPRSAILRHDGRTWVFVQEEEEEFARKPVTLDSPLENGWFVTEEGGLKEDDRMVVTGSQVLLSEEMKAAAGTAEEE